MNRPNHTDYAPPLTPEHPDLSIPLGEVTLDIFRTADGCDIQITNKQGARQHAASIMYREGTIAGTKIPAVYLGRAVDVGADHFVHIVDELLLPPDPNEPHVIMLPDGTLFCTTCRQVVENTANAEMRKEGCFAHSHVCPGPKGDD